MANCECCGAETVVLTGDLRRLIWERQAPAFRCHCTEELFCRGCNHCERHCQCSAGPALDVPLTEQLAIAKRALKVAGV